MENSKTILLKSGHSSLTRGALTRSSNSIRLWLRKFGALDKSLITYGSHGGLLQEVEVLYCSAYFSNYFRNISCTSLCCKKSQSVCGFVALSSCVLIFDMIFGHNTIHHRLHTEKIQLELTYDSTRLRWVGEGNRQSQSPYIHTIFTTSCKLR